MIEEEEDKPELDRKVGYKSSQSKERVPKQRGKLAHNTREGRSGGRPKRFMLVSRKRGQEKDTRRGNLTTNKHHGY